MTVIAQLHASDILKNYRPKAIYISLDRTNEQKLHNCNNKTNAKSIGIGIDFSNTLQYVSIPAILFQGSIDIEFAIQIINIAKNSDNALLHDGT